MSLLRLRRALDQFTEKADGRRLIRGLLGRPNPGNEAEPITYVVADRPDFVHVRVGNENGTLTPTTARNTGRGRVPHRAHLPILMRRENGVLVIVGEDYDSGLLENDTGGPDSTYGVYPHPLTLHSDISGSSAPGEGSVPIYNETDGVWEFGTIPVPSVLDDLTDVGPIIGPFDGDVLVAEGGVWVNTDQIPDAMIATIDAATEQTTPGDTDQLPLTDSGALKWISWANIKAQLSTLFGGLFVKQDGTTPLTGDWDIGEDRKIKAERIDARDTEGLAVYDAGGNLVVFFAEGGWIGSRYGSPAYNLHIAQKAGAGKGILLAGKEVYQEANGSDTAGALIMLGVSRATFSNRQVWMMPTDNLGSAVNGGFRMWGSHDGYALFGGISGDGATELPITINPNGETVFVGAGSANERAAVGGILYVSTSDVGNSGGGEDNLISYTIPADTLSTNGDSIWFEAVFYFANNGNTKTAKVYFGATTLITIFGAMSNTTAVIRGRVIRTGSATQESYTTYIGSSSVPATAVTTASPTATLSSAVTIKGTGESAASASNDVVMRSLVAGWHPANS